MPLRGIFYRIKFFIVGFSIAANVFVRCDKNCWTSFNAKQHFKVMDNLDDRYAKVRENYQETVGGTEFDENMLVAMVKNRGMAERAIHEAQGDRTKIPAGINLGGYCMMKLPKTMLFFHRMKLRNDTRFRITNLKNDLANLLLKAQLLLNDLRLFGSYDYTSYTDSDRLVYEPTFGQVELLLSNVKYNIEGRYRLLKNRLNLELIVSEINMDNILMMYRNKNSSLAVKLEKANIEVFIDRLKVDLDQWLKDYFNDYLMYFVIAENDEFLKYNQEKTAQLNNFTDNAIDTIIERIHEIKANAVQIPTFNLFKSNEKEVKLRNGVLRGLDSIYRRGIATGTKKNIIRNVDAVVGFSNLKLIYRYDAILKSGLPPVTGNLILTADELTAQMSLSLIKEPETADLSFKFLEQARAESLTVEGPANRMISNFKYLLERHIIAIMTNSLMHIIKMLGTLDRCVPLLKPYKEEEEGEENREEREPDTDDAKRDNIANNITNFFESDPQPYNSTSDKILIGDNVSEDNDNLSQFQYYHRRIPLRNNPRRKQQKRFNKFT